MPSETFLFADDLPSAKTGHEDQATKLLEWLVRFWTKPSITARDIARSGPHSLRDKKTILNSAQTLEARGWLTPIPTWRRDKREWKIARGLPLP
jgi:hypothetical protein